MASETITQNDLREILSRTVGAVPSEYRKLLWSNPSPTSAFSAQTVALDLSSYDDVEIEMAGLATSQSTTSQYFTLKVGTGGLLSISANNIWWRYVTPRTTGVEFGAGYKTTTYGSGATVDNTQMTPIAIYGIKYERVAPPQVEYNNYSTEEQEVGTFIDGKTIYRKSKLYTWSGTTTYDNTFFQGISVDRIVRQRTQITKNANYAQESFYWTSGDYNRCWISLTNNPPVVCFSCSQSAGCEILITVDYTKA